MIRTWPLRPAIATTLGASTERDLAEIAALPKGGVWVKILFNACDVEGCDYAGGSWRLYLHREMGEHPQGEFFYELQEDDGEGEWYAPRGTDVDGKPQYIHESGHTNDLWPIIHLYPYWAELTKRQIRRLQEEDRRGAEQSMEAFPSMVPAVCNVCAYDAGGSWSGIDAWGIGARCPLCEQPGWVNPLSAWTGLPEALAVAAEIVCEKRPIVEPILKVEQSAVAAILALRIGESYVENGCGPCVNGHSDHDLNTGYCWHEWRVRVLFDGERNRPYRFAVESRSNTSSWAATDFGMTPGRSAEKGFEWYADASGIERALLAMRSLRDLEQGDYEDPAYRHAQGITEIHLRTGMLSERTKAEIAAEAKVAA